MKFLSFAFALLLALPVSAQQYPDDDGHRFDPAIKIVYCQRPVQYPGGEFEGEFMECSVTGKKDVLLPLIGAHMSDYEVMREYKCGLVTYHRTGSQGVRCPTTMAQKAKKT